ncbi:hypothetical protein F2Q69_00056739 [Brassica cretica]|uniref:Uncharacterized protein n=1 Tax=Brassica cretica TaxID=69181 RepID=A0A8S9N589_BRACR|nr:hypothetical protein F2Q69_00056739 [Brassica cretica]
MVGRSPVLVPFLFLKLKYVGSPLKPIKYKVGEALKQDCRVRWRRWSEIVECTVSSTTGIPHFVLHFLGASEKGDVVAGGKVVGEWPSDPSTEVAGGTREVTEVLHQSGGRDRCAVGRMSRGTVG